MREHHFGANDLRNLDAASDLSQYKPSRLTYIRVAFSLPSLHQIQFHRSRPAPRFPTNIRSSLLQISCVTSLPHQTAQARPTSSGRRPPPHYCHRSLLPATCLFSRTPIQQLQIKSQFSPGPPSCRRPSCLVFFRQSNHFPRPFFSASRRPSTPAPLRLELLAVFALTAHIRLITFFIALLDVLDPGTYRPPRGGLLAFFRCPADVRLLQRYSCRLDVPGSNGSTERDKVSVKRPSSVRNANSPCLPDAPVTPPPKPMSAARNVAKPSLGPAKRKQSFLLDYVA